MILTKTKRNIFLGLLALAVVIIWVTQQSFNEQNHVVEEKPTSPIPDDSVVKSYSTSPSGNLETAVSPSSLDIKQIEVGVDEDIQNTITIEEQALIAAIEADMELTLPLDGDLSYMSPENETVQPINPEFPAVEPTDANLTLGQEADENQKLGTPFKEVPEID